MSEQYVADARSGVFWMHDAVFDHYAKEIGVYGVAVYGLLCRRANSEKRCWPSLNSMAKSLAVSRSKLVATLEVLEEQGLISREQRQEEGRGHTSTVYTLLQPDTLVRTENKASAPREQGLVRDTYPKEYTEEGIHIEGREKSNVSPLLNEDGKRTVQELLSIKNWDKGEPQTIELVTKAVKTYGADRVLATATNLAFKMDVGAVAYKKPSKAFANWLTTEPQRQDRSRSGPVRIRSREI